MFCYFALCQTFQHFKMNFQNDPHFLFAGDTPQIEDKFILYFIMQWTQLNCGTVMNIT